MVCDFGTNVVVCGPPRGVYHRTFMYCVECDRRHRFVIRWDGAYYGTTDFGSCGDRWQEGWRFERPFQRGWRQKAQQEFRAMWDNAAPKDLYNAYVDADLRFAVSDGAERERACDDRDAALAAIHANTEGSRHGHL